MTGEKLLCAKLWSVAAILGASQLLLSSASAQDVYLNSENITVEVGPGTSGDNFHNTFSGSSTIEKVIDAPSADAEEFHSQTTHIWHTAAEDGGGLELLFDFGREYDVHTLHFWNYTGESYDVDNIEFTMFNKDSIEVGSLSVMPDLGSSGGIEAQDLPLAAPLNVQFVTALLSGSNREVDFQNIGFTAVESLPVPEPSALCLLGVALAGVALAQRN